MTDRSVPADIQAERDVLGSILLEREAILAVSDTLHADDFYLEKHALIFQAMLACLAERVPPDISTVATQLRRQAQLDIVGGITFLGGLLDEVPTAVHVGYYAQAVAASALRRRLIQAGGIIVALGYDEEPTVDVTLDLAEQTLFAVSQTKRGEDFVPMRTVIGQYFDESQQSDEARLSPTGLLDLDQKLGGGFRPGQLVLLAARPSMGKTGMALSIAYAMACRDQRVGVVSLEMGRSELTERLLAMHTGMNTQQVGPLARRGDERVIEAMGVLAEWPLAIEDRAGLTVMDVRSKARRLAAVAPLDLLIVDYLQLLDGGDSREQNRNEEVSRISRQLKLLARELQCPVLALSQLSREVEKRASKIPQLSDLRDSGSLEQDADIVLFIYRADAYAEKDTVRTGIAEIVVAKHRNGPVGTVPLRFDATTTRFQNLSSR